MPEKVRYMVCILKQTLDLEGVYDIERFVADNATLKILADDTYWYVKSHKPFVLRNSRIPLPKGGFHEQVSARITEK
ncbi:unnamed protein product [Clonostachys rosea]|uniref:Uncharacterized protein n=1 Tax=Bionectria ochroleuca TaxID=29856 RepID=A0ABY6UMQ0_BIOOC|nr:unnamed protein product [Clonostachys rosea]